MVSASLPRRYFVVCIRDKDITFILAFEEIKMESKNTLQGFIWTEDEAELVLNTDRSSQQVPGIESKSEDIESSGSVGVSEEERSDEWFVGWMATHSTPDQDTKKLVRCLPSDRSPKLKRDPLKQIKCFDPNTRRKSGIKKSATWNPRGVTSEDKSKLRKCFSDAISIQSALSRQEESDRDLIGDFSRPCQLPVIQNTKHSDLNVITHETMASILNNGYPEISANYMVVDCRYPYEFEGGHIQGAQNIYKREDIIKNLLDSDQSADRRNTILIFHCEFSAERGPTLLRHLRNFDRNLHTQDYPSLEYPEIYLLEGGYKNFFEHHSELCCPRGYKQMADEHNSADLTFYRSQTRLHKRVSSRSIKTTPYERDTTRANLMDQIQTTELPQKGSTLFL